MRIAAITPVSNQDYLQFESWRRHYSTYGPHLYKHVVVDNGCEPVFASTIQQAFPESIHIRAGENRGTTGAFNLGVETALLDANVEAILLIVQDVCCNGDAIPNLIEQLKAVGTGIVSGAVLYGDTPNLVEWFGGKLDATDFSVIPCYRGKTISDLPECLDVDFVPGGVNLASREIYEKVGVQDTNLFMYCDEVDWDFRAKGHGYKLVVTKKAVFWHNHITNPKHQDQNRSRAIFYDIRNRIYLIRRYHGLWKAINFIWHQILRYPRTLASLLFHRRFHELAYQFLPQLMGIAFGALNIMGRVELFSTSGKAGV